MLHKNTGQRCGGYEYTGTKVRKTLFREKRESAEVVSCSPMAKGWLGAEYASGCRGGNLAERCRGMRVFSDRGLCRGHFYVVHRYKKRGISPEK